MKRAGISPRAHLFVCANRRDPSSPLGPGCGDAGDAAYDAAKSEVARRQAYGSLWVTKTHCLGVCPRRGCTVAIYPMHVIYEQVEAADAAALVATIEARGALP